MSEFLSENSHFLVVKFLVYLNRHVFIMTVSGFGYRFVLVLFSLNIFTVIFVKRMSLKL